MFNFDDLKKLSSSDRRFIDDRRWLIILIEVNCQTPDQTKIKIQSNQKSGEALYLGSCSFVVCLFVVCRNAGYNLLIPF